METRNDEGESFFRKNEEPQRSLHQTVFCPKSIIFPRHMGSARRSQTWAGFSIIKQQASAKADYLTLFKLSIAESSRKCDFSKENLEGCVSCNGTTHPVIALTACRPNIFPANAKKPFHLLPPLSKLQVWKAGMTREIIIDGRPFSAPLLKLEFIHGGDASGIPHRDCRSDRAMGPLAPKGQCFMGRLCFPRLQFILAVLTLVPLTGCDTSNSATGESEQAAVAEIRKAGGEVKEAFAENAGDHSDVCFPKRDDGRVSDDDLRHVAALRDLRKFSVMDGAAISDVGISYLRGLKNLDYLYLADTKVTDDGLANLEGMDRLHMLFLENTQITDAGLEHLKHLKNLAFVYCEHTRVTPAGANRLAGQLPACTVTYSR